MDTLMHGLVALAAAFVSAAVPILLPYLLELIRANVHRRDVALIADAAARAAGRISVAVADQMAKPGANLKTAISASIAAEVVTLKGQLPEVIAKVGASDGTLASMITGEVGKLVAVKVGEGTLGAVPSALREFVPHIGSASAPGGDNGQGWGGSGAVIGR